MDWKLELLAVPVSDVDRAKTFDTEQVGLVADHDHRVSDTVRSLRPPRDPSGPKVDDPDDFVRLEVVTALEHGIPTIPVLVDGAQMPAASHCHRRSSPWRRGTPSRSHGNAGTTTSAC